ncbi:MAG: cytochrome C oxidase subunit IV family protein [Pyrinomonadaceae bacterium]
MSVLLGMKEMTDKNVCPTVMSEHIVSLKIYVAIFLALMAGTALTVWAGLQDFPGHLNVIIALTIAVIKATLVVLYFMHVRYSSRLVWVVFASALFWLGILFALTFSDYWTRSWLPLIS